MTNIIEAIVLTIIGIVIVVADILTTPSVTVCVVGGMLTFVGICFLVFSCIDIYRKQKDQNIEEDNN